MLVLAIVDSATADSQAVLTNLHLEKAVASAAPHPKPSVSTKAAATLDPTIVAEVQELAGNPKSRIGNPSPICELFN
jgi:hypothetical protein